VDVLLIEHLDLLSIARQPVRRDGDHLLLTHSDITCNVLHNAGSGMTQAA
jgi:hypothetical protein